MSFITEIADSYEARYGFMAVNAVHRDEAMFHSIHCDLLDGELREVEHELVKRGWSLIKSEDEYKAGIAKYGVPPEFQNQGRG